MKNSKIKADKIIFSQRRTLGIQIDKDAQIVVRAPIGTSQKAIDELLQKHKNWVKRGKEIIGKRKHKKYIYGEEFMFLGKPYLLKITKEDSLIIRFEDKFYLSDKAVLYGKKLFTLFYKENTLKIVRERCEYYATCNELHYNKIGVTNAETRWGSCSYKNNLNFSYRLAMAPMEIIDYIVVHELAHIIEKNHSAKFWETLQKMMPDYKERRKLLRKNELLWRL